MSSFVETWNRFSAHSLRQQIKLKWGSKWIARSDSYVEFVLCWSFPFYWSGRWTRIGYVILYSSSLGKGFLEMIKNLKLSSRSSLNFVLSYSGPSPARVRPIYLQQRQWWYFYNLFESIAVIVSFKTAAQQFWKDLIVSNQWN